MAYKGVELSASVMCMNWLNMSADINALEDTCIDFWHYDIMDGYFVPEFGLANFIIRKIKEISKKPSDYHLMTEEPKRIFNSLISEENAYVGIHYEACRNLHRDLITLKKMGFRPNIILNPATTLQNIEYVIGEVNLVTIMTVDPGYSGQELIQQTINKVSKLDKWRKLSNLPIKIAIDGNVSLENIPKMVAAGGDFLVLGSSGIFSKGYSLQDGLARVLSAIDEGLHGKAR